MSFCKVLLAFVCVVFLEVNCTECCDDFDCSFYATEDDCEEWLQCKWESSGTCRDWTCADENSQQGCVSNVCAWTGTACKIPTSCSELKETQCSLIKIGDDTCNWIGGACKAVTCDDFKNSITSCEDNTAWYVILDGFCKFSDATGTSGKSCKLTTSCAEWSDRGKNECEESNRCFENERCMFDENTNKCRNMSCSDLSSSGECWSIRQWNFKADEYGYGYLCKWSETDNSCTSATSCADFNGKGKNMCKINPFHCYWDEGSSTCSPKDCESFGNDKSKCYNEGCYYRDICTVEDPSPSSSSAIFTPMFLIAVILALVL